uniref:L51_S25_CI-B8 domain-containing protein n=1 Tax=Rhabditophanes sp. KR3021 TaxID=114890 RepID=A0AC35UE96_9BILA
MTAPPKGQLDAGPVKRMEKHRKNIDVTVIYSTEKYPRVVILAMEHAISRSRPQMTNCGTGPSMNFVKLVYPDILKLLGDYLYRCLLDDHKVYIMELIPNPNNETRIAKGFKYKL